MQQFNEGLKAGDLDGIVADTFSVDRYKSKMGEDKNICVLAFVCSGAAGAKDLEKFAEANELSIFEQINVENFENICAQTFSEIILVLWNAK